MNADAVNADAENADAENADAVKAAKLLGEFVWLHAGEFSAHTGDVVTDRSVPVERQLGN